MPSSSLQRLVDRLVRTVGEDLPLWIESASIAGSYARDERDEHSDLDLFFLIAPGSDVTVNHAADTLIDWVGDVVIRRGPVLVPHFGHSITAVLPDLAVCQMNVNTRETIELNPMRSASRIVLDRDGYMTSLVEQSKSMLVDISKVYHEHFCYFWIRALYAFRSAQRGSCGGRSSIWLTCARRCSRSFASNMDVTARWWARTILPNGTKSRSVLTRHEYLSSVFPNTPGKAFCRAYSSLSNGFLGQPRTLLIFRSSPTCAALRRRSSVLCGVECEHPHHRLRPKWICRCGSNHVQRSPECHRAWRKMHLRRTGHTLPMGTGWKRGR